jgi:hypothetical protein
MRFERVAKREIEFAKQRSVSIELLVYGVDENRFARSAVGEQVGVSRCFGIDQLTENHNDLETPAAPPRRWAPGVDQNIIALLYSCT